MIIIILLLVNPYYFPSLQFHVLCESQTKHESLHYLGSYTAETSMLHYNIAIAT